MRSSVERRAPLHPALVSAGADERVPDELPGLRIEQDIHTALSAEPDDVTPATVDSDPHDVRP